MSKKYKKIFGRVIYMLYNMNIKSKLRGGEMAEIKYDIIEKLGVIGEGSKGWKKEVNIISWNGRKAKLDIRDWDEDNEKMGKGITLSKDELKALKSLLNSFEVEDLDI